MGAKGRSGGSSGGSIILVVMTLISFLLGGLLFSNHEGVKQRAAEVDRVKRDMVDLAEEMRRLSELERNRAFSHVEQERLARERLHWTRPREFIIRVEEP